MKQLYSFIISLLLLSCLFSCKKENNSLFNFGRITTVDSICQPVGVIDSTDWTYDTTWVAEELNFVHFIDTVTSTDTLTGTIYVAPVCPNPTNGLFYLNVVAQRECQLKCALVNTNRQLVGYLAKRTLPGPSSVGFDVRTVSAARKNRYYRLYYAFYTSRDSLYYKGHGDIFIQ